MKTETTTATLTAPTAPAAAPAPAGYAFLSPLQLQPHPIQTASGRAGIPARITGESYAQRGQLPEFAPRVALYEGRYTILRGHLRATLAAKVCSEKPTIEGYPAELVQQLSAVFAPGILCRVLEMNPNSPAAVGMFYDHDSADTYQQREITTLETLKAFQAASLPPAETARQAAIKATQKALTDATIKGDQPTMTALQTRLDTLTGLSIDAVQDAADGAACLLSAIDACKRDSRAKWRLIFEWLPLSECITLAKDAASASPARQCSQRTLYESVQSQKAAAVKAVQEAGGKTEKGEYLVSKKSAEFNTKPPADATERAAVAAEIASTARAAIMAEPAKAAPAIDWAGKAEQADKDGKATHAAVYRFAGLPDPMKAAELADTLDKAAAQVAALTGERGALAAELASVKQDRDAARAALDRAAAVKKK